MSDKKKFNNNAGIKVNNFFAKGFSWMLFKSYKNIS